MNSDTATVKSEYPTKSERREAYVVREHFVHVEDRPVEYRAWLAAIMKRSGLKEDFEDGFTWHRNDFISTPSTGEHIMLARQFDPKTEPREMVFRMRDFGYSPAIRLQQYAYLTVTPSLFEKGEKIAAFGEGYKNASGVEHYPTFECHALGKLTLDYEDCRKYDPKLLFLFVRNRVRR